MTLSHTVACSMCAAHIRIPFVRSTYTHIRSICSVSSVNTEHTFRCAHIHGKMSRKLRDTASTQAHVCLVGRCGYGNELNSFTDYTQTQAYASQSRNVTTTTRPTKNRIRHFCFESSPVDEFFLLYKLIN